MRDSITAPQPWAFYPREQGAPTLEMLSGVLRTQNG